MSHDVPYPMDYGGVIDIFCTIKALHAAGVQIILHCFDYGRGQQPILDEYCAEVHYYPRQEGHKGFCFHLPYIVASRMNADLLDRLAADPYPILVQGIHCSCLLEDERFRNRRIALRLFNVETTYYKELAKYERSLFKKAYFIHESRMLEKQEKKVAANWPVLTLSEKDRDYYKSVYHARQVDYIPVFHPHDSVDACDGVGSFCLYHGNLSVAENEKAAIWLVEQVFSKLKIPFVIAGKNPSARLERIAQQSCHTCLIANPEERELQDLLSKAQINILPSFNKTGIKLKLLNALFNGRHCVVNQQALDGSPLAPLCHAAETPEALQRVIMQLYHLPFGEEEIRLREKLLGFHYNNATNLEKLKAYL